jgi:CBS-domain-containing membrane protein
MKDALDKRTYDSMPTSKGTTLKEPLSNEHLTQQLSSSAKLLSKAQVEETIRSYENELDNRNNDVNFFKAQVEQAAHKI